MLKFARRRARSSEREPVKCLVMNNSLSRPRASSAERAPHVQSSDSPDSVTVPQLTPSRVEARTASIQSTNSPRHRSGLFEDVEADLPAYSMSVTSGKTSTEQMTVTVSHLSSKLSHTGLGEDQSSRDTNTLSVSALQKASKSIFTPPPVLPRKPLMQFQHQRHLWKMELLDTSAESGYGTDSSDNNSLKSVN